MSFPTVNLEGGLLSTEVLEQVGQTELGGQRPESFGLAKNARLSDEIARTWSDARAFWDAYGRMLERTPSEETATSDTRERWMLPLLRVLGYELRYQPRAARVERDTFAISHRAISHAQSDDENDDEDAPPVHIVGARQSLDRRESSQIRLSPHALVQEYLNRTEHLWGVVTNGEQLRLLRDSQRTAKPTYVEFDLRQMLEGEHFADFALFYRLVHRSRLPQGTEDAADCLLESYHQEAIAQGGRIRDRLRDSVEAALTILANGFLRHPKNEALRQRFRDGGLSPDAYYQEILYVIYRLLFLFVAEERQLLTDNAIYRDHYSLTRLRRLAERKGQSTGRHHDLWLGLQTTFYLFHDPSLGAELDLPPLNGELFSTERTRDLEDAYLGNDPLLRAIHRLTLYRDAETGATRRVNYAALDVEELGSVYESLLEFEPVVRTEGADERPVFDFAQGTERKSTGSYYTRPELVGELVKSALEPVLERRLAEARTAPSPPTPLPAGEGSQSVDAEGRWRLPDYLRDFCREMRQNPTPAESFLWSALRNRQLAGLKFRRQHPIGRYVVDFFCHEQELIVEVIGDVHDRPEQAAYDETRSEALQAQGYSIVTLRNEDVLNDPESALQRILDATDADHPSPLGRGTEGEGVERTHGQETASAEEEAILSLTVCDPACGSGHFLLAAARRLGRELARIRSGEPEPTPEQFREAVRDTIAHCIYGVDLNPLAVDLCKVALWLEGHTKGKPLTFLDHRIKLGNSLIGVQDLDVLKHGIPDDGYKPVDGEDKDLAKRLKQDNKRERKALEQGESRLFGSEDPTTDLMDFAAHLRELETIADDTPEDVNEKARRYNELTSRQSYERDRTACDLWTAAFFAWLTEDNRANVPTTETLRAFLERGSGAVQPQVLSRAETLSIRHRFFHWPLEFPEVFSRPLTPNPSPEGRGARGARSEGGGFDVVLSNPPWERIKLEEKQFFATRDREIAEASNKSERTKLINQLADDNPDLYREYLNTKHDADAQGRYLRGSEQYPLTAYGDINTYSVFAGLGRGLISAGGRAGMVVPTGIATDNTNKHFFADLVEQHHLASLYDFENRSWLFSEVAKAGIKFSLVTLRGSMEAERGPAELSFFNTRVEHLSDDQRRFTLTDEDFRLINPNTRTCPVFRTQQDAELTKKIYRRVPVLVNEADDENPWGISFLRMFDMSNDSDRFHAREGLEEQGAELKGNRFVLGDEVYLPLYEAKMIHHFDHRLGSYEGVDARTSSLPELGERKQEPSIVIEPWYWVSESDVKVRLDDWQYDWFLGFRDVTRPTEKRTAIFSLLPWSGVGNKVPIWILDGLAAAACTPLLGNCCSLVLDYVARQKIGGTTMNFFYVKQFPVLPPSQFSPDDLPFIASIVLELTYTSWDIKPFADDVWADALTPGPSPSGRGEREARGEGLREAIRAQWEANKEATGGHAWELPDWIDAYPEIETDPEKGIPLPPFKWDEDRRARLRAELDAYYAQLYGLTEEELRYILDPKDVYGADFPGETFRVLKEKEIKQFGEYRTKRLVLEAWERLKH